MKKITLLAALLVAFTMNAQVTIWEDGFESYDDYIIENIGDWTLTDVDGDQTYASADYDFENEGYTGVGIIFNPANTTPSATGTAWDPRTGSKGFYMVAESVAPFLNDDYLITPAIDLTSATGSEISFWAKSITDAFGLERFEVLLSTTGTDVADFDVNLSGGELQAPLDYTEYSYDLSAYDGETVYVAVHYMGQDSFVLQLDDFVATAASLSTNSSVFESFTYFVDANNVLNLKANAPLQSLELYNVIGQQVVASKLSRTSETFNMSNLESGVYIAKVSINGSSKSFKIVKR